MNTNVDEAFQALGKLMIEFNSGQKTIMNSQNKNDKKKTLSASGGKDLNSKKKCC